MTDKLKIEAEKAAAGLFRRYNEPDRHMIADAIIAVARAHAADQIERAKAPLFREIEIAEAERDRLAAEVAELKTCGTECRVHPAPSPAPSDNGPPGVCYNPPTPEVADTLHRTQSTPAPGARIPFGPKCTYAMCVCGKGCGRLVESAPSDPERCNATNLDGKTCTLMAGHASHHEHWPPGATEWRQGWWDDAGGKPHTPAETAKETDNRSLPCTCQDPCDYCDSEGAEGGDCECFAQCPTHTASDEAQTIMAVLVQERDAAIASWDEERQRAEREACRVMAARAEAEKHRKEVVRLKEILRGAPLGAQDIEVRLHDETIRGSELVTRYTRLREQLRRIAHVLEVAGVK